MTLLTIAIPTFERERELRRLLECLDGQIADDVIVQVSDNHSGDGTAALLAEWSSTRPWLRIHRQPENTGPFRNLVWLVENAPPCEYIWLFGDDDLVVPGSLTTVLDILRGEPPAWLFLPHQWIDRHGRVVPGSPAPGAVEHYENARALYLGYHHWLTFLTASIVRRAPLREAVAQVKTDNAYRPLLWYFRAGFDGPCTVAPRHVIHGSQAISWEDKVHVYLTEHFTSLWEDGLSAGLTREEFGATLDGLYGDPGTFDKWRRVPLDRFASIVERFPESRALRSYLFTTAMEQSSRDALPAIERAARTVGALERAWALVTEGEGLFGAGDVTGAVDRFTEATSVMPTLAAGWNDLAVGLHELGRLGDAQAAAEAALFADPYDADARENLAAIATATA